MRILIISYYFPPVMNVGGFRAMSWARRFSDAGHDVTVIKGDGREAGACAYFEESLDREVRVITVHNPLLGESVDPAAPSRKAIFEPLKDILRAALPVLDGYVVWSRAAYEAAAAEIRQRGDFDAVVSTSFPLSAHEVAMRIKADREGVWVADFRDFYGQFDSNRLKAASPRGRYLAGRLRAYGASSDLVVTVSERLRHIVGEWIEPRKSMVVYNGFFKEHLPAGKPGKPSWSILYTGSYNAGEFTVAPLATALAALREDGVEPPEVLFSGHRIEAAAKPFEDAGLSCRFIGPLSNRECLDRQREAGFLLLCDAMSGPGALLTKTFEYLAARRPIIVITREGSDLRETVFNTEASGYCLASRSEEIASFLRAWRDRGLDADGAGVFYENERIESFSREAQADLLLTEIGELVKESEQA